jgi:hypothetical protein
LGEQIAPRENCSVLPWQLPKTVQVHPPDALSQQLPVWPHPALVQEVLASHAPLQPFWVTCVQSPPGPPLQHAPRLAQGFGLHASAEKKGLPAAHCDWSVPPAHAPVFWLQHAPVAIVAYATHGSGEQDE